jgi:hypothetical protein
LSLKNGLKDNRWGCPYLAEAYSQHSVEEGFAPEKNDALDKTLQFFSVVDQKIHPWPRTCAEFAQLVFVTYDIFGEG